MRVGGLDLFLIIVKLPWFSNIFFYTCIFYAPIAFLNTPESIFNICLAEYSICLCLQMLLNYKLMMIEQWWFVLLKCQLSAQLTKHELNARSCQEGNREQNPKYNYTSHKSCINDALVPWSLCAVLVSPRKGKSQLKKIQELGYWRLWEYLGCVSLHDNSIFILLLSHLLLATAGDGILASDYWSYSVRLGLCYIHT